MKQVNPKIIATILTGVALMLLYIIDIMFFDILFKSDNMALFFAVIISSVILMSSVYWAEDGKEIFIREILLQIIDIQSYKYLYYNFAE